jgi:hypothetical protein
MAGASSPAAPRPNAAAPTAAAHLGTTSTRSLSTTTDPDANPIEIIDEDD